MLAYMQFGELFQNVSSGFCHYAGSMLVQSMALVFAIFALDAAIHRRVRAVFRYWIWTIVLVKLLLPPTLSSPTGIGYWCAKLLPEQTSSTAVGQDTQLTSPSGSEFSPDLAPAGSGHGPSTGQLAPSSLLSWSSGLFVSWLAGVLLLSVWLIRRVYRIHLFMLAGKEPGPDLARLFEDCRRASGARWPVSLRIIDGAVGPAVFGVFRPVVLLPARLHDQLDRDQLRTVLLHELTHVARGDLVVHAVQVVLQILHFYNPLVWLANLRIGRLREQAVDEAVLVALGNPAEYSRTLVEVAALSTGRASLSLGLMGVVESRVALSERLSHILSRPVPRSSRLGTLGFVSVIALAAACLPMSGSRAEAGTAAMVRSKPPAAQTPPTPAIAAVPAGPTTAPATPGLAGGPRFRCDEPTYDFGESWDGDEVKHVFIINNDGEAPLQIDVKPACGCTTAKDYDKIIAPHGKGQIPVVLKIPSYTTALRKQILVTTNDTAARTSTLTLVGKVKMRISTDPPSGLNWGQYTPGMSLTRTIKVTNNMPRTMQLKTLPGEIGVYSAKVQDIQAGKTAEIVVIANPPFAEGSNAATLKFSTGIAEKPELTVYCSISVPSPIEVKPPRVSLERSASGEVEKTVRITCNDEGTLKLTSVTAEPPAIGTQVVETEAGKAFNLQLTIPAGLKLSPSHPGRVIIQTNRADQPQIQVDVFTTATPASRPTVNALTH